jgi:putative transposase
MSSRPGENATPKEKKLSDRNSISRSASSKSNSTGSKEKLACSTDQKRQLVEPDNDSISVCRQCELIGLSRASFHYELTGESDENLLLVQLLDEQYTRTPFYGVLKMTAWLRENGHPVNCKRVRRLLRLMGLEAIYPKPRLATTCVIWRPA